MAQEMNRQLLSVYPRNHPLVELLPKYYLNLALTVEAERPGTIETEGTLKVRPGGLTNRQELALRVGPNPSVEIRRVRKEKCVLESRERMA